MLHITSARTMYIGLVVGMILLISRYGICMDDNGRYVALGMGTRSCGKFVYSMRNKDLEYKRYFYWIEGYLTGVNIIRNDTNDILGTTDMAGAMLWLENYCNKNPLDLFVNAALNLTIDLIPNRITKEPVDNIKRK